MSALSLAMVGLVLPPQSAPKEEDRAPDSASSSASSSAGGLLVAGSTPSSVWEHVKSLSDDLERKKESVAQLQAALEEAENKIVAKDAEIRTLEFQAQSAEEDHRRRLSIMERENQDLRARVAELERAAINPSPSNSSSDRNVPLTSDFSPARLSRVSSASRCLGNCGQTSKKRLSALDLPTPKSAEYEIYNFLDRFDRNEEHQPAENESERGPGASGFDGEPVCDGSVRSVTSVNEEGGSGRFTQVICKVKQELFGALERLESMRTRSSRSDKLKRLEAENKSLADQLAERDDVITVLRRRLSENGQGRFGAAQFGSSGDLGQLGSSGASSACTRGLTSALSSPCSALSRGGKFGLGHFELQRTSSEGRFDGVGGPGRRPSPFGPV
eukprot:tig00000157_g9729.t1